MDSPIFPLETNWSLEWWLTSFSSKLTLPTTRRLRLAWAFASPSSALTTTSNTSEPSGFLGTPVSTQLQPSPTKWTNLDYPTPLESSKMSTHTSRLCKSEKDTDRLIPFFSFSGKTSQRWIFTTSTALLLSWALCWRTNTFKIAFSLPILPTTSTQNTLTGWCPTCRDFSSRTRATTTMWLCRARSTKN